jgi:hypothetical protein
MAKRPAPIPSRVRINRKRTYEIVHIDSFKDEEQLGEARHEPPQIVIKRGQSSSEELSTIIHEIFHSFDFEEDIKLTESQVLKLEKSMVRLFRLNPEFLSMLYEFYKKK